MTLDVEPVTRPDPPTDARLVADLADVDLTSAHVGPHFCLGAHLARLERAAMLRELLERTPDVAIAGPVTLVASNFINEISRLPVRLEPAR